MEPDRLATVWPHENEILQLEADDRRNKPSPGRIVFTGSSTMRFWRTLARDFPFLDVLNRGFGGSVLPELVHYFRRIVVPYHSRAIVVYSGENDIAGGASAEDVAESFDALLSTRQDACPDTPLMYVGIKPSPGRQALHPIMQEANRRIQASIAACTGVQYVDVQAAMLGPDGLPNRALFMSDGVHLSRAGYACWRDVLTPWLRPYAVRDSAVDAPR
ncbi:MAG: GDSL-type esterase/lipase family protein [Verrucomicrobia bacterium]|nr:GDSL-type esterase/lipase family protein [Verrucomicrobiota bacterium]